MRPAEYMHAKEDAVTNEAPIWIPWGKTMREGDSIIIHPLLAHMLDVGEVAGLLWDSCLAESLRTWLSEALSLPPSDARQALVTWAALHDLGKATPAFQRRFAPAIPALEAHGLGLPPDYGARPPYHGTLSSYTLIPLLQEYLGLSPRHARDVALVLGGHHGSWPEIDPGYPPAATQLGDACWDDLRRTLVRTLVVHYAPPVASTLPDDRGHRQTFLTLVAGLVSVADWLGSMEDWFFAAPQPRDVAAYAATARRRGLAALEALHWTAWQPPSNPIAFKDLVVYDPNSLQRKVIALTKSLDEPALMVIEAPTGCGKTEAALYLADHWARVCQQRGLYVAMPTMATSNQMWQRVCETIARRYPDLEIPPLLVHSQARWERRPPRPQVTRDGDDSDPMSWFLPRKRSLLAPLGVGTVDQALMAALRTRHYFVRLFGLAHKTILFDEVHAYDTYMSTLFQRLLRWLAAQGSSVVMLSATLPARTRQALVRAYLGDDAAPLPDAPYPAITVADAQGVRVIPAEPPQTRTLRLDWIPRAPDEFADRLRHALRYGGCAAVLCNTVARAQTVYQAFQEAALVAPDELILFHARYPQAWRHETEQRVLKELGKDGARPQRCIVVATQVIEQSLDLDFDLMITDLAPIDLLLQRAGRLHRHERAQRPQGLAEPQLWLAQPDLDPDGLPDWGSDAWVYEPYVLLRTYLALQGRAALELPAETQALIEAVYGPEEPAAPSPWDDALRDARQKMERARRSDEFHARSNLVLPPEDEMLFSSDTQLKDEEDPTIHQSLRALTRLGPPSIQVVCLHRGPNGLTLEPDGGDLIDLDTPPDDALAADLAHHAVAVSHHAIYKHLANGPAPAGWRKHSVLRYYRAAIFDQGIWEERHETYTMQLSRELGLRIARREQDADL